MVSLEKAIDIFSPLDAVVLQLETQTIVRKKDRDQFDPLLEMSRAVEKYILVGEHAERNPTYWQATMGKKKEETEDWLERIRKVLEFSSPRVNWTDLDNNNLVVTVASEFSMLLVNCKDLTPELTKELKCATIHTAFGKINLEDL